MDGLEAQTVIQSRTRSFPRDIVFSILLWLPVKSVIKFTCVCKSWYNIIRDPAFRKLRLHSESEPAILILKSAAVAEKEVVSISYIKQEGLELADGQTVICNMISPYLWTFFGTCDGLLCFATSRHNEIVMACNPVTREHIILPKPSPCPKSDRVKYAFGFDPIMKKYKVVRILHRRHVHITAEVYALGDPGSWRKVGGFHLVPRGRAVYANGAVYWMVRDRVNPQAVIDPFNDPQPIQVWPSNNHEEVRILSFDLGKEEFGLMRHIQIGMGSSLAEVDGRVSVVDTSSGICVEVSSGICVEVSVMDKNSWKKEHILPVSNMPPQLICASEHNGVLMLWLKNNFHRKGDETLLIVYNSRKDLSAMSLSRLSISLDWEICGCYRSSLVSLRDFVSAAVDDYGRSVLFLSDRELEYIREQNVAQRICEQGKWDVALLDSCS